jgi:hypothetical protein
MIFIYFHVTLTVAKILRSRYEVVPSQMSQIVIYVCTLIKCVSVVVKYVSVVVNLSLSQMSLMLLEFTYFIFTIIDIHLPLRTQNLSQNIHIVKININPVMGPKCDP